MEYNLPKFQANYPKDPDNLTEKFKKAEVIIGSLSNDHFKSINQINELKNLKKEIKQLIKTQKKIGGTSRWLSRIFGAKVYNAEELKEIEAKYNQFVKKYDEIVESHPGFKAAREVSKAIRVARSALGEADQNWLRVDEEFRKHFEETVKLLSGLGDIQLFIGPKSEATTRDWESFRQTLIHASTQLRSAEALQKKTITWMHGTRSPALAVMLSMDKVMRPTGVLIERGVYPLTGELGVGITPGTGVNVSKISGTSGSQKGVKVVQGYAFGYKVDITNDWERLSDPKLSHLIEWTTEILKLDPEFKTQYGVHNKYDWLATEIYLGRLKIIDPDFNKKVPELKERLSNLIKECEISKKEEIVPYLKKILVACDTPPFIEPSELIRDSVVHSFPIILASTSIDLLTETKLKSQNLDEFAFEGELPLERIQVAFTEKEQVEKLQSYITSQGLSIKVLDFDALRLLKGTLPETGPYSEMTEK
jgi:hypothetical protein